MDAVVAQLPMGVWMTDAALRLTYVVAGPGVERQILESAAVVDCGESHGYDVRYPQHPDVAAHLRARAGETVLWRTGWSGSLHACAAPAYGKEGQVEGVIGAAVDMTMTMQEEERRRRAEHTLYSVLDHNRQAMALLDGGHRVLFANQTYLDATGRCLDEVLGRQEPVRMRVPEQLVSEGGQVEQSPAVTWRDAQGRIFQSTHIDLPPEAGNMSFHLATDVTETEGLREAVACSQAQIQAVLEGVGHAVAVVDSDGRIECANMAFHHMLDASTGHLIGASITNWITPTSHSSLTAMQDALTQGDVPHTIGQILFQTRRTMVLATVTLRMVHRSDGSPATTWTVDNYGEPAEQIALQQNAASPALGPLDAKILELLAAGHNNAAIATQLCLSRQGLDYRLKTLRTRLRADSRGALVARAYHKGIFEAGHWPPRCRRECVADRTPDDQEGYSGR
ncbi:PAS domain-containing protein [Streptomyces sp. NRRL B-1347]|uniref:PAS domain-containing protein n=1 Tax=Streptomyces sp. NRRL B-1347 TaxID=1476877 RepID=UPI00068BDD7B|nr:PAS domain-containing protein [Streptomyces sp. NRRL B-1347]